MEQDQETTVEEDTGVELAMYIQTKDFHPENSYHNNITISTTVTNKIGTPLTTATMKHHGATVADFHRGHQPTVAHRDL